MVNRQPSKPASRANSNVDLVIISPVAPGTVNDGHKIAILSDLDAATAVGFNVGLFSYSYSGESVTAIQAETVSVGAKPGGFAARLCRGLFGSLPPSIERFYSAEAEIQLKAALKRWRPKIVIIDDLCMGGWLPIIRDLSGSAKVVFRSHNVMADVRASGYAQSSLWEKPTLALELARYRKLENFCSTHCDAHWAITDNDAARMAALYGCSNNSTLPISVDVDSYSRLSIEEGNLKGFVHIGTIDYRRRKDFLSFMHNGWTQLLLKEPTAMLYLAGESRIRTNLQGKNVQFLGRVQDDLDVYRRGRFAVNFQRSTGGVKVKSLTSMAAGRVLISTPEGVEGLKIESGTHFHLLNTLIGRFNGEDFAELMANASRVSRNGREWVSVFHSKRAVAEIFGNLIQCV